MRFKKLAASCMVFLLMFAVTALGEFAQFSPEQNQLGPGAYNGPAANIGSGTLGETEESGVNTGTEASPGSFGPESGQSAGTGSRNSPDSFSNTASTAEAIGAAFSAGVDAISAKANDMADNPGRTAFSATVGTAFSAAVGVSGAFSFGISGFVGWAVSGIWDSISESRAEAQAAAEAKAAMDEAAEESVAVSDEVEGLGGANGGTSGW